MRDGKLSVLALADVIYSNDAEFIYRNKEKSLDPEDNVFQFRPNFNLKYYVGQNAIDVLHLRGAINAISILPQSVFNESDGLGTLPETSLAAITRFPTKPHPYNYIDVEWNMSAMDILFKASFKDLIRDENNAECSAQHLAPLIKEYKMRQVAQGLHWMIKGWKAESIAKFLRVIFKQWLPDLAGLVYAIISQDWEFSTNLSLW